MKIAFWSNVHGQVATTSNLLAIALYSCIKNNRKISLLQSHYKFNNLEFPLLGHIEKKEFCMDTGIDALLRDCKSGLLTKTIVLDDAISLLNKQCSLYLGTTKTNQKVFESDMLENISQILKEVDNAHEITFIDVVSGHNALSDYILGEVDLIVVNLCQNQYVLNQFFETWNYKEKSMYLIGRYDSNSEFNKNNLCKIFPELKSKVGLIKCNVEFMDAINQGNLIKFIMKNIDSSWYNNNFSFMQLLDEAVALVEKRGGVSNHI